MADFHFSTEVKVENPQQTRSLYAMNGHAADIKSTPHVVVPVGVTVVGSPTPDGMMVAHPKDLCNEGKCRKSAIDEYYGTKSYSFILG